MTKITNINIETDKTNKNNSTKTTIIGGVIIAGIVGGIWFALHSSSDTSIENIAENITETSLATPNEDFINSLTMNNIDDMNSMDGEEILEDVFIGDTDENSEDASLSDTQKKYLEFAKKIETAVEKKDFTTLCATSSQCNSKSTDAQVLAEKEKQYASHTVEYFPSEKDENVLCYTETIHLKNDANKNPIVYTYHVGLKEGTKTGEFELQKPRCEKVIKEPYGDITNRSPYSKKCGADITRILCEKI